MRRILMLVSTVALALLLVGGVAASKQRQEAQSTTSPKSPTPTQKATTSSGGDVSIQSTTVKASFASGSGANFLGVKVSNHGNLLSFESPAGQEAVFVSDPPGNEGYKVCSDTTTLNGRDTAGEELGFGTPTFAQPNGAGAFPLSVTRKTTDGKFQLKQVWAKPDAVEKDVTVTMTLKNISSSTIQGVYLHRTGEFDVGPTGTDRAARTNDSAWQWDDNNGFDSPRVGLMLTALTFATPHNPIVQSSDEWLGTGRTSCGLLIVGTLAGPADFAMGLYYSLDTLTAGQSKTVKFEYGRM
jgi:hypothetical protein